MTLALPEDKCKQQCPRYGRQTFLQVETKPEDDPSIPFMVRSRTSSCITVVPTLQGLAHLCFVQALLACMSFAWPLVNCQVSPQEHACVRAGLSEVQSDALLSNAGAPGQASA